MGGESSQQQQQTQQSISQPWAPAQPLLRGILSQVSQNLPNTALTGSEIGALNTLENNAGTAGRYAPQIGANATELLNGGGALNQAGAINQNYRNYYNQTNPLASNTNYDPSQMNLNFDPNQNPGMAGLLDQIRGDVTNQVNGSFAAAGRDFSGANQGALGRGIAQGEAPALFNQYNANRTALFDQYNANRAAQQGAAGNLYNAGNTNAGLLSGLQQQALANKQIGTQAASQALDAQNAGANATLQAEAARRGIPVQALGLLAQIGIPIAGLGGQTNSTGSSSGTRQMSGAEQFGTIAGGFGKLFSPLKLFGG